MGASSTATIWSMYSNRTKAEWQVRQDGLHDDDWRYYQSTTEILPTYHVKFCNVPAQMDRRELREAVSISTTKEVQSARDYITSSVEVWQLT